MKRLLAQIGITAFTVLAVAFYISDRAVMILLLAAAVVSAAFLLVRKARQTVFLPVIALTVVISCAMNLAYTYLIVLPTQEDCAGEARRVEATLTEEPYRAYSKYCYPLKTEAIDGKPIRTKLLLKTARPITIEPFDHLSFTADIAATVNQYNLAKGYYLTVNTYETDFAVEEADNRPLYYQAIRLRRTLREALDEYLPRDVASLCKAILVGDKYALGVKAKDAFRYAGASYFVVVSGLHFSIICLMFYRLLKRLRVHRAACAVLTLALILFYMAVTGFQPSVVRSGVMMAALILAGLVRRIGYSFNSLGFAALVSIVVFSPYGMGDIGMILSFAATFAILAWSDPIYQKIAFKNPDRRWKRLLNKVLAVLSMSLAANILVFPISVYVFRAFSSVTLLSSLCLYLPIWLMLVLSMAVCLFHFLGPLHYLSLLLSWPLYGAGRLVLWIVNGLASLPFSYVYVGDTFVYIWLNATIILGFIVVLRRNQYRWLPIAALLSAVIFITGMVTTEVIRLNTMQLEVYDCGDGMTVGLNCRGNLYLLSFDCQSKRAYRMTEALSRRYGGAELAVSADYRDNVNYSRLSDREFAISRRLMYDDTGSIGDEEGMLPYDSTAVYPLDDGVMLSVTGCGGKLLSYLTVNDTSILVVPKKFPYQEIPEVYRRAEIIVMTDAAKEYEGLACDMLVVSSTAEHAHAVQSRMSGSYRRCTSTADGDVYIDLR